jgi:hypothetical protein
MKDFRKLFPVMLSPFVCKNMVGDLHLAVGLTAITYEQSHLGVLNYSVSSENIGDRSRHNRCLYILKKGHNRLKLYPADSTYGHISASGVLSALEPVNCIV